MTDFKSELRDILESFSFAAKCTKNEDHDIYYSEDRLIMATDDIIALFNKQLLEKERGVLYAIDRYLRLATDPAKEIEEYITDRLADIKGEIHGNKHDIS